jgi:hypothetical protein
MNSSLEIAISNLTSITVLIFFLGLIAGAIKSDTKIPEPIYQFIAIYLLFGIGLKGGVALRSTGLLDALLPILATLALGITIPVLAYVILGKVTKVKSLDRGSIAAHYGSTSLVTFTAALVYLDTNNIEYEGFVTTLLTVMEVPGIVVGIFLAKRHLAPTVQWSGSLKEIFLGKTLMLLVGGLLIGYVAGTEGYVRVEPFFVTLLPGVLALFLLHLGYLAGERWKSIIGFGPGLIMFSIFFPLAIGSAGTFAGSVIGLSAGGAMVLGILAASASYIAAPAAVRVALPEANISLPVTMSLVITFPINLLISIPLLTTLAQQIA